MQINNIEVATYYITETVTFGDLPGTPPPPPDIAMVGYINIILLAAYVIISIHNQNRRENKTKFSSRGQQSTGRSTAYKNVEGVSFLCLINIFFVKFF